MQVRILRSQAVCFASVSPRTDPAWRGRPVTFAAQGPMRQPCSACEDQDGRVPACTDTSGTVRDRIPLTDSSRPFGNRPRRNPEYVDQNGLPQTVPGGLIKECLLWGCRYSSWDRQLSGPPDALRDCRNRGIQSAIGSEQYRSRR